MQEPSPAPRLTPTPVSPGAMLLRQFVTLLLLMISLAISFAFLFVQQVPTNPDHHATLLVIWGGIRPDMVNDRLTPHLNALAQTSVVGLDNHASLAFSTSTTVTSAPLPATTATPSIGASPTATAVASPTASPSDAATPTATPPGATPAATHPPASATPTPVTAQPNAPAPEAGTIIDLAQAALAKGSAISYEGAGAALLQQSLPNLGANAYILGDGSVYPQTLTQQLSAQGVTLPSAATDATHTPDAARIAAFTQAYVQVILPKLKATSTPFLSIIREPEPETTATLNGIGAESFAAALQADDNALGDLMNGLQTAGLGNAVNLVVTSDHGLAAVVPPDQTSAASVAYTAPTDAVRTDLAQLLAAAAAQGPAGLLPDVGKGGVAHGSAAVTKATTIVVTAQGGNDTLTFTPSALLLKAGQGDATNGDKAVAQEVVRYMQTLPQIGPLFVNDTLSPPAGALPLSDLGTVTAASPALVVGFETFAHDVGQRSGNSSLLAGSEYADTAALASWGAFGRRDLHTILYLSGPNFKSGSGGYGDIAPTSFADVAPTIETIMGLDAPVGQSGRVINEALVNDTSNPAAPTTTIASAKVTNAQGASYVEVLVTEHFVGFDYSHAAYAIHAQGPQNLDDLITQATTLANGE